MAINQFNGDALRIRANNCRVTGCYVGVLFTGTEELSNAATGSASGVRIDGGPRGNVIGSPRAAARNVISGNDTNGVLIHGRGTNGNAVLGNFIGTDAAGTGFVGNGVADTPRPGTGRACASPAAPAATCCGTT